MKNSVEFLEILISTEIKIENNILVQNFLYDKKYKKFLIDSCYKFYDDLERKLRELSINEEDIVFSKRINDNGIISLYYDILDESVIKRINKKRKFFKLADYAPPTPGCAYCRYRKKIDENFFFCDYKTKTMTKEIKKCRYFKQGGLYNL